MASNIVPFPRRNDNDNNNPTPPQPGLRSFIVFDELPENCISFEVVDMRVSPHFSRGEFAIVDEGDREPMHGELFLIQWDSGAREIVEVEQRTFNFYDSATRTSTPGDGWLAIAKSTMVTLGTGERSVGRWFDGPYRPEQLRNKLVGRVVGIHEPDFRTRLAEAA